MMKNWMIAGLMGATVLTGIAPLAATAAEQDRSESRWNDRRTAPPRAQADEPARQRGEARTGWRDNTVRDRPQRAEAVRDRPQRVEAVRDIRQDRVEAVREAQQERVVPVQENRRDGRNDRRDDTRSWRQSTREDRQDVRQGRRDDARDWRQNAREERRDDVRERRQDVRRDWQNDRDGRENNRDWRDNRRDYRDADRRYSWDRDWRRNQTYDWQRYRQTHRHIYRGPSYYAPRGWDYGYRRFSIGISLWSGLYADRYWIGDPGYYRLPPAYGPLRWVRYYDDALLVDIRTGYVVDVIHDFFF